MKYLSDSLPQTACIPLSFGNEAPEQALGILSPEPSSDEEKREYAKQTAIRHAMSIEDYRLYLSARKIQFTYTLTLSASFLHYTTKLHIPI